MRTCCIAQGTLLHFAVQQKLTQHCKTTIPQFKTKKTFQLETQHIPIKTPRAFFTEIEPKNSKSFMKPQKTPNSQSNTKRKE